MFPGGYVVTELRKVDSDFHRLLLETFYVDKLKPLLNKKIKGGNPSPCKFIVNISGFCRRFYF